MAIESNPKYLDAVLELLGLEGAKDVPTPSVPTHKEKLTAGELLNPAETTVYRQCLGGLLYYTQDRADAQYEVSILGSMLVKPGQGSMIALKRVTRYLKGTRETSSTNLSWTVRLTNTWQDWMGFQTVTGLVRRTGSHSRVACFSWMECLSVPSVEDSQ